MSWRYETIVEFLKAVTRHPEWVTVTLEVFGVAYFCKLLWGIYLKIHRAAVIMRGFLMFLAFSLIVWICWNYVYIEGVNPFNGRIHPDYQIAEETNEVNVTEVINAYQKANRR